MGYKTVKLTLVRHAKIDGPAALYGSLSNVSCLKPDLLKITRLKQSYTQIYCSPLKRCVETASLLIPENASLRLAAELKEMSFGRFDGLPFEQYTKEDEELINQETEALPGAEENYPLFKARVLNFIDKILTNAQDKDNYLLISHGGVIACLIANILKLPIKEVLYHMSAANRAFTQLSVYIDTENNTKFWEISSFNNQTEP